MTRLYACTSNAGKMREFQLAGADARFQNYELVAFPGIKSIPAPEETGSTFEANAALKARYYSQFSEEVVLADDSGLEVDALGGAPGVFSARFAGDGASDEENNRLLLERMAGIDSRTARFTAAIALAQGGEVLQVVRASVEGTLLHGPLGQNGFGYDPLFYYPPFGRSFAEIASEQKLGVSHRGKALRQALDWLRTRS